jgi:uncharacterized protein YkwD
VKRALALVLVACAEPATMAPDPVTAVSAASTPASTWAEDTRSPRPAATPSGVVAEVLAACGEPDDALMRLAAKPAPPSDLAPALREVGSPYMRAEYIDVTSFDEKAAPQLKSRLGARPNMRCGIAADGASLHIVRAEALADLAPLPVRSRTGAWLTLDATVHAPAKSAKVVVVGPRGAPKTFPTRLDAGGHARARCVLDRPGAFQVQLIAELDEGNRPLAEALVFADVAPSHSVEAPGEREPSLEAMVAAVRKEEGVAKLERDPRLDALAAAHVAKMAKLGRVAHDLGDGDFAKRFQAEGYAASVVGENVGRAGSLALAHRALWESASHRLNLLHADYTRIGLATVTDAKGATWVCETFSSELQ